MLSTRAQKSNGVAINDNSPTAAAVDPPPNNQRSSWFVLILCCVPFGFLWFSLISQLQVEWTNNEQYSYGFVVPLLSVGLLWTGWVEGRRSKDRSGARGRVGFLLLSVLFALAALLYLPARFIHEAVPMFRPAHWLLAMVTVALTLLAIYSAAGPRWAWRSAFAVSFILIAVPWPSPIERFFVQGLARADALITVELLSWIDIPAMIHGKVIEIGTGLVGINDACSGIRSFQSSLMVALFLGELYKLKLSLRVALCVIGLLLAFALNVARTSLMVIVASKEGVAAIDEWHDPAGVTITLICLALLWGLSLFLKGKGTAQSAADTGAATAAAPEPPSHSPQPTVRRSPLFPRLALGLAVWLISVEVGTAVWWKHIEKPATTGAKWSINWPEDNPSFERVPISPVSLRVLRCDLAEQGQWSEPAGVLWHVFALEWFPGRLASYFANRHRPEICMTAAGYELNTGPDPIVLTVHGMKLPFKRYAFRNGASMLFVYHCIWQAGAGSALTGDSNGANFDLLRGTSTAQSDLGRQVLEFAVSGLTDFAEAEAALVQQLERMLNPVK